MRKFFEEPTLEMTFFDAENVVTESATAENLAKAAIVKKTGSPDTQTLTLIW